MYYVMRASAPSLHRESTNSLILYRKFAASCTIRLAPSCSPKYMLMYYIIIVIAHACMSVHIIITYV